MPPQWHELTGCATRDAHSTPVTRRKCLTQIVTYNTVLTVINIFCGDSHAPIVFTPKNSRDPSCRSIHHKQAEVTAGQAKIFSFLKNINPVGQLSKSCEYSWPMRYFWATIVVQILSVFVDPSWKIDHASSSSSEWTHAHWEHTCLCPFVDQVGWHSTAEFHRFHTLAVQTIRMNCIGTRRILPHSCPKPWRTHSSMFIQGFLVEE